MDSWNWNVCVHLEFTNQSRSNIFPIIYYSILYISWAFFVWNSMFGSHSKCFFSLSQRDMRLGKVVCSFLFILELLPKSFRIGPFYVCVCVCLRCHYRIFIKKGKKEYTIWSGQNGKESVLIVTFLIELSLLQQNGPKLFVLSWQRMMMKWIRKCLSLQRMKRHEQNCFHIMFPLPFFLIADLLLPNGGNEVCLFRLPF